MGGASIGSEGDGPRRKPTSCGNSTRRLVASPLASSGPPYGLAASPEGFSRILDSFVSLRPQERHVRFNSELLPAFYGLLRAALSFEPARAACISTLATHRNWEWAIRYILVESLDYANLLAGSLHPALNAPRPATHSCVMRRVNGDPREDSTAAGIRRPGAGFAALLRHLSRKSLHFHDCDPALAVAKVSRGKRAGRTPQLSSFGVSAQMH